MPKNPANTRVHQLIRKAGDLECHLRVIEVEGVRVLEFRDFIPSTQSYGRGYWIPLEDSAVLALIKGLSNIPGTAAP